MATPSVNLQITDNQKGVILTVDAVDAAGVKTAWPAAAAAPAVTASDAPSSAFSFEAPVATPTGYTVQGDLVSPQPTPLHTGVAFSLSVDSGFDGQTAPISVTASPAVDIVGGPATGFTVQEAGD